MNLKWSDEEEFSWFQKFCINVVKAGPVPKHIAFIMDGNRRFARKSNISYREANLLGVAAFKRIRPVCRELGVREVTCYAFSIENFSRNQEQEVCPLMQLGTQVLHQLLNEDLDTIKTDGYKIRIFGDLSLLEPDMKKLCVDLMNATKNNNKYTLNVACAYSSRNEITQAVKDILEGVEKGLISEDDVDEFLITNCLYYKEIPEPDILVRSSGVVRISNFMLWQLTSTQMYFVKSLWPEIHVWPLLALVFMYQHNYKALEEYKTNKSDREGKANDKNNNVFKFLEYIKERRSNELESYLQI